MVVQNTNIGYTVFGILNEPFFNSISLLNKKVYVTRNKISKKTLQIFGLKTEKEGSVRLSMPMVVQWLKAYNPVATIRSPMATIMGIRHLNNDRDPEPDYIYVGKISDLFPGSVSSEVVLVHRQDVVSLKTAALEEVFDCLSDALVYYQNWEDALMSVVRRKNPHQFLIDVSEKLLGTLIFVDTRLKITAASSSVNREILEETWKSFWERGRWRFEVPEARAEMPFAEAFETVWEEPLELQNTQPGEFHCALMFSQTDSQGHLLGQMILLQKQKTAQYQQPLLAVLAHVLEYNGLYTDADAHFSVENSLFREILQSADTSQEHRQLLMQLRQWKVTDQMLVVVLCKMRENTNNSLDCLEYLCRQPLDGIFALAYPQELKQEEVIVGLLAVKDLDTGNISEEDADIRLKTLFQCAEKVGYTVHISYHHPGLSHVNLQYGQALVAAEYKKRYFYHCAVGMLTSFSYDRALCLFSLHKAPQEVLAYDREHGTEYYHMLHTYLWCERNRNETARRLFVHKNTLAYRLQKMEELFRLNLDDGYEREYLLLSMASLSQQKIE